MVLKSLSKKVLVIATFLFFSITINALEVPSLTGRVVDNANILSNTEKEELTTYLESLENTTGIQIAVLTIPSLEGDSLESYSIRVVENWKLGQEKEDNGALLLVSYNDKKIRIETGYGLEGKLTDAKCGLIIRNIIAPKFQSNDYGQGIIEGVKNMGGIASDDATLISKNLEEGDDVSDIIPAIIFLIFITFMFVNVYLDRKNPRRRNITSRTIFVPPLSRGDIFSSSSKNNFGGFGGGGFSGGGGGFGGGGASGSW